MGQISQTQHKNDAAGEYIKYWTLQEGSYMMDFNVVLLALGNSDMASVSFERTKTKYSFLKGSWTPPFEIFFNRKLQIKRVQDPAKKKIGFGFFKTD